MTIWNFFLNVVLKGENRCAIKKKKGKTVFYYLSPTPLFSINLYAQE